MPSPGTLTRYDIVGVKEDVSNIISNISPYDTPFQSAIGSETVDNTVFSWQEDSLLGTVNLAALEGADAPAASFQPTVMRSNGTQILTLTAKSSGTADRVKKYGRERELAYQLKMRSKELKRSLEYTYIGVGASQVMVTGSNTVARQMAGAQAMIPAAATNTLATPTGLAESMIVGAAQAIYTAGAKPTMILVKPADTVRLAALKSTSRTTFVQNDEKKISNVVDVYESPFGALKVVKSRQLNVADALIVDPSMWKKAVLRNWSTETMAKTGDSTNVQILGEMSLKHLNFGASFRITGLAA